MSNLDSSRKVIKNCKNCDTQFTTTLSHQVYCCRKCHREFNRILTNQNYHKNKVAKKKNYTKYCKYCLEEFETFNKKNIFCKKICMGRWHQKIRTKLDPEYAKKRQEQYRKSYRKRHGIPDIEGKYINHPGPRGKLIGYINPQGYRMFCIPTHPNASKCGKINEHTIIMSEYLGRPLLKGENVHHKNGIRDDNRIENLELWNKTQPSGQRVEDKINWCKEFLTQYGYIISDPVE